MKLTQILDIINLTKELLSQHPTNNLTNGINYTSTNLNHLKQIAKNKNIIAPFLEYNIPELLKEFTSQEGAITQFTELPDNDKKSLFYFDKSIYPILRNILPTIEFNFLFDTQTNALNTQIIPPELNDWLQANSKVAYYKLRKNSPKALFDFFNNIDVINCENNATTQSKEEIVRNYITHNHKNNLDWYESATTFLNLHPSQSNTFHTLLKIENEITSYDVILDSIKLPSIIQEFAGTVDNKQLENELLDLNQINDPQEKQQAIKNGQFPTIQLHQNKQKPLTPTEFTNLINLSKNTPYEEFFNNKDTLKASKLMPYQRIIYCQIQLRKEFIKLASNKPSQKQNINYSPM